MWRKSYKNYEEPILDRKVKKGLSEKRLLRRESE